jgi:2-iminobutanoate/2-iminopropanoate deaminase
MHDPRELRVSGLPEPVSHFMDAVLTGRTPYVSGVVATDSNGDVVGPGDVRAQARQVFRNLALVLEAAGATPPTWPS